MASLRTFHIFFLLVVIAAADFFGIWCINEYRRTDDVFILCLGLLALLGGLGLIFYAVWFIRKLNRAKID